MRFYAVHVGNSATLFVLVRFERFPARRPRSCCVFDRDGPGTSPCQARALCCRMRLLGLVVLEGEAPRRGSTGGALKGLQTLRSGGRQFPPRPVDRRPWPGAALSLGVAVAGAAILV